MGIASAVAALPSRLRVLPLALFALIVPSYVLRGIVKVEHGRLLFNIWERDVPPQGFLNGVWHSRARELCL